MDPITVITSSLASIKAATEIAKLLKDADLSLEKAELKLKLADLIGALADAKLQIVEIQSIVSDKDKTIEELEQKQDLKAMMKFERPYYWIQNGDERDGPYCQKCYDSEDKPIRLQKSTTKGLWYCRVCKSDFHDNNYDAVDWKKLKAKYQR